jgi:hypothetical protein
MKCDIKKFGNIDTPANAQELVDFAADFSPEDHKLFGLAVRMTWNMMVDMIEVKYHADKE